MDYALSPNDRAPGLPNPAPTQATNRPPNPNPGPRMNPMQRAMRPPGPVMNSPIRKRFGDPMPNRGMPPAQRPRFGHPNLSPSHNADNNKDTSAEDDCIMILEPETNTADMDFISKQLSVSQPQPGIRMSSPVRPVGPPRMSSPARGLSPMNMMTRPRRGRPPVPNFMVTNPRMPRFGTPPHNQPNHASMNSSPQSSVPILPEGPGTSPKTPPTTISTSSSTDQKLPTKSQPALKQLKMEDNNHPDSTNSSETSSTGQQNDPALERIVNIKQEKKLVPSTKPVKRETKDPDAQSVRSVKPVKITKRDPDDPNHMKSPTSTTGKSEKNQSANPDPNFGGLSFGHPFPSILSVESLAMPNNESQSMEKTPADETKNK